MRLPNICNWNPETTVLSHIRRGGDINAGMSKKPCDLNATWACSDCHDVLDRRNNMGSYTKSELDSWITDAHCRYLVKLVDLGVLKW